MREILKKIVSPKKVIIGGKNIDIGEPIEADYSAALEYFERKYKNSYSYIKSLIVRFDLRHVKIVSIGSGYGAEEVLFSELGDNNIYCIEPDELSRTVCNHFINTLNVKKIRLYNATAQSFESKEKFDVMYTSSPSDWMATDFRECISERYIQFINTFGKERGIVIFRLYGGNYDKYVVSNSWFLKSLILKINRKSKYKLMEYWISDLENESIIIASSPDVTPTKELIRGFKLAYAYDGREVRLSVVEKLQVYKIIMQKFIHLIPILTKKIIQ